VFGNENLGLAVGHFLAFFLTFGTKISNYAVTLDRLNLQ